MKIENIVLLTLPVIAISVVLVLSDMGELPDFDLFGKKLLPKKLR